LLREVVAEVIHGQLFDPRLSSLTSVVCVDVQRDLREARVYVKVLGSEKEISETLSVLQGASGYISVLAAKRVTLRYFPSLSFFLDESVAYEERMHELFSRLCLTGKGLEEEKGK